MKWASSMGLRPGTVAMALLVGCTGSVGGSHDNGGAGDDAGGAGGRVNNAGAGGTMPPPPASAGLGRLDDSGVAACKTPLDPGPARNRRLTRREYNNTVADLLFDTTAPARDFPTDERTLNFDNNAEALTVSATLAEGYQKAAQTLASAALTSNFAKVVPCDPVKDGNGACGMKFIQTFGARAFRRPLTTDEINRFKKVFDQGVMTDFKNGASLVIQAMLQSAPFLYRVEFGEAPSAGAKTSQLNSWEMASRLSYFLWASMPDDQLFAAAMANKLTDRNEIRAQVTRMLASDKTHRMMQTFHEQWLGLGDVVSLDKDKTLFPAWAPDMMAQLKEETARFVDQVVWNGGTFETLLRAPYSVINGKIATLYGLSGSSMPGATEWKKVDLDPAQRSGILTQGSVLAYEAKINQTSPVRRGKFIREQLFGTTPPPPPPEVNAAAPDLDPKLTTRERFAQHSQVASCANCHKLMDPLGLGLENFDAVGRYRAEENGKTIDASGEIVEADVNGPFVGVAQLAGKLAESKQVKRVYVSNWFRFAYGRTDTDADACLLHQLDARFVSSKFDLKSMVTALTETEAFLTRRTGGTP